MRQTQRFTLGRATRTGVKVTLALGAVAAATTLAELALVPGLAIGAAVLIAPRLVARPSRKTSRAAGPRVDPFVRASSIPRALSIPGLKPGALVASPLRALHLKEATLKTISFRVIVTVLDFGFNYVVLGDLATSAGLSVVTLLAGPFFYFLHETSWTYLRSYMPVEWARDKSQVRYVVFGVSVSHAVAKTITYRLFATVSEFSTNLIVVQNVATAAYLSSFGFFIGPFIYYAHERLWETLGEGADGRRGSSMLALPPTLELAAA